MAARPRCLWLLLGALLAGALGACEVSTEEKLLALRGTDFCVLKADITLSGPIMPIDFWGELDGQGHWIRNIDFDIEGMYGEDTSKAKDISAGLFTNPKSLSNLGLEFKVNFINELGEIGALYLGAVGLSTGLTVRDVIVNGSLSAKNGSSGIGSAYIGGIAGYSTDKTSTLGPNVTSYCNLECRAGSCFMGGLAGGWNGEVTEVAAILDSIKVEAEGAYVGGIVGWSESAAISESFADVGEITAAVGGGSSVGGFVGYCTGTEVSDSYASVSRISVTSSESSTAGIQVSPFVASFSSGSTAGSIARCYSWLDDGISVDADDRDVTLGGLVGYSSSSSLSISASFSYISNAEIASSKSLYLGGLCGLMSVSSGATNPSLNIQDAWTVLQASSISATFSAYVGGLCGDSSFDQSNAKLANLDVTLYMNPDISGTAGLKNIGALAGGMNGTISGVLLRATCLQDNCASIPLVAYGTASSSGVNVINNGWEVTAGAATGQITKVAPGTYDEASYEGLPPSNWDFHDSSYPTLSKLPVYGAGRSFSNPEKSTWPEEMWAIPDAEQNTPQLVKNKKCKGIGGNFLCVDCEVGVNGKCRECERDAELLLNGMACMACLETCSVCGAGDVCLECERATPYLDTISGDAEKAGKTCLDFPDCAEAGGIADGERLQCRAARDLCGGEAEPRIEDCASCPEANKGEALACARCATDFLVDKRAGSATLGKCVRKEKCTGTSAEGEDKASCLDLPCAGIEGCALCGDGEALSARLCAQCGEGLALLGGGCEEIGAGQCKLAAKDGAGRWACVEACPEGQAKEGNLCRPCADENCRACSTSAAGACLECAEGHALGGEGGGACLAIGAADCPVTVPGAPSGPLTCAEACPPGQGPGEARACAPCPQGCARCGASAGECEECGPGLLLDRRDEGQRGEAQCMKAEDCKDLAAPREGEEPEAAACASLACAEVAGCTKCDGTDSGKCAACGEAGRSPSKDGRACLPDSCVQGPGAVAHCTACLAEEAGACAACGEGWSLAGKENKCLRDTCLRGPTRVEHCAACEPLEEGEGEAGDSTACRECEDGWLLNLFPEEEEGAALAACLSREECREAGGMLSAAGGEGPVPGCAPMKCGDDNCADCFEGAGSCAECEAGFLLEAREGREAGTCIPEAECTGTSAESGDGKACVALGCAGIERCIGCREDERGRCQLCEGEHLVDERGAEGGLPASETLGKCIPRKDCTGTSEPSGAACVRSPCAGIAKCTKCSQAGSSLCAECGAGFLLDLRGGQPAGGQGAACIPEADCKDLGGPGAGEDRGKCVALPCSQIQGCARCDAADETVCGECDKPFALHEGFCRDDCLAGPGAVAHCVACVEGSRACGACEEGYALEAGAGETPLVCQKKAGLSAGAAAGITGAAVLAVAVLVGLCLYFLVCRRRKAGSVA